MGSGAETVRETATRPERPRRARRRAAGAAVPAVRRGRISRRTAAQRSAPSPCWSRPRNPARRASRSIWMWLPRLTQAVAQGNRQSMPLSHRRPLRPVVEGLQPGAGQGGVRRTAQARTAATALPSASTTMSRTPASRRPGIPHRAAGPGAGGVLRPGRRRHRGRQQEHA